MSAFDSILRSNHDSGLGRMIVFSILVHLAAFSLLFFSPGYGPSRTISGQVFEVNLVDFPSQIESKSSQGQQAALQETAPIRPTEPAKRIAEPTAVKEKPVTIAKKVVETPKTEKPKPPTRAVEDALARIEKKVEEEQKRAKEREAASKAVAELGAQFRKEGEGGGRGPGQGVAMRVYEVQVANLIKRNWSFPAAHLDPKSKKELEATVLVTVRNDGTIVSSRFAKRSPSPSFDESVQRAIDRSSPLPPFPEGYRMTMDEFEIRFNLADLDSQ